ncbi:MAG: bifunctional oligoribonuclease/PAP phosphatase NrnA [Lachnospiraceae bacterium]|nr:bifunctional oligoribonuclease/PAP phosphatase NrnA [Lachnospiraceae bacterium]
MTDILKEASGAGNIAITGHIRPDGDCVGSCLALWCYLTNALPDATVTVYMEEPSEIFSYLKGYDSIDTSYSPKETADICFALDASTPDRLGDGLRIFNKAKKTVCIDHHVSNNGFADLNDVDPDASSTCEMLALRFEKKYMDTDTAKALFTGIVHDSGVFQYSCMSKRSFEVVGDLCEYDFDRSRIIDETFYQKTYVQNQILGRTLLESILFMDGKCIAGSVDRKIMEFYNITYKDMDGIVNQLRVTKGVEVAIFMYELHRREYKISMRSNGKVDVAKIATLFGGGGHVRAAGCTMNGTFYDVLNNLSLHIEEQLKEYEETAGA